MVSDRLRTLRIFRESLHVNGTEPSTIKRPSEYGIDCRGLRNTLRAEDDSREQAVNVLFVNLRDPDMEDDYYDSTKKKSPSAKETQV